MAKYFSYALAVSFLLGTFSSLSFAEESKLAPLSHYMACYAHIWAEIGPSGINGDNLNSSDKGNPVLFLPTNPDAQGFFTGFQIFTPYTSYSYTMPEPSREKRGELMLTKDHHLKISVPDSKLSSGEKTQFYVSTNQINPIIPKKNWTDIPWISLDGTNQRHPTQNAETYVTVKGKDDLTPKSLELLRDTLAQGIRAEGRIIRAQREHRNQYPDRDAKTEEFHKTELIARMHGVRTALDSCKEIGDPLLASASLEVIAMVESEERLLTGSVDPRPDLTGRRRRGNHR